VKDRKKKIKNFKIVLDNGNGSVKIVILVTGNGDEKKEAFLRALIDKFFENFIGVRRIRAPYNLIENRLRVFKKSE
jgi:hypothetical protein